MTFLSDNLRNAHVAIDVPPEGRHGPWGPLGSAGTRGARRALRAGAATGKHLEGGSRKWYPIA
jgi:hypothetical protein